MSLFIRGLVFTRLRLAWTRGIWNGTYMFAFPWRQGLHGWFDGVWLANGSSGWVQCCMHTTR